MAKAKQRPLADRLFDLNARVEKILWVPGAVAVPGALPECFEEFINDIPENPENQFFAHFPNLKRFAGVRNADTEQVAMSFRNAAGFLVQAATPAIYPIRGSKTAHSCSWGNYYTQWLYADTTDEIYDLIAEWVEERHAADRKRKAA